MDLVRSSISTAVESVISVSFIGIIVRLSPLISLVDELAMYAYHRPKYDSGFSYLSELFLDWTKGKWVPPFCDPIAAELAKAPIYGQTVR